MSTLRRPAQLADLQGELCVRANKLTNDVLLSLTCCCGSVLPPSLILVLLWLSIEPTTPVSSRVASKWRERHSFYNGDPNSSEMARAPPVGRREGTKRTAPSNYVRTTLPFRAHSLSWLLVPPVCRRARTTQTAPSNYVRTTLLFGAHSSYRLLIASVLCQPCRIDQSAAELPTPNPTGLSAPCSASMLHSTPSRAASTSPKIARRPVLCFCASGLRHMHDAPRISILESTFRGTIDGDFACRESPIGLHTPLLTEPDRSSRGPVGLRAPCSPRSCRGSFLVVLPRTEQAVLAECLGFLVWRFLPVHVLSYGLQYVRRPCLARRTSCCAPFLLKITQLQI